MRIITLVLAFSAALAWLGPELDDLSFEQAIAQELEQIQREELRAQAQEQRFAKAAREICGENASYRRIDEQSMRCVTKRGHLQSTKVSL